MCVIISSITWNTVDSVRPRTDRPWAPGRAELIDNGSTNRIDSKPIMAATYRQPLILD